MIESEPDVLIVEDDNELRDALCRALEVEGFVCHSVKDAWQALALIEEDGSKPRLIVLDLMMPRMNGWEFLDRRKRSEDLRKIPVVVLSAAVRAPAGGPPGVGPPALRSAGSSIGSGRGREPSGHPLTFGESVHRPFTLRVITSALRK